MKLLATYNAKSSFAKINSFLWQPFGLDVPLIMSYNSTVYGYLVDANKNVLGLFNPSKTRVATYLYGPFGQKLSESGTIAANNPLQFSSEQFDADLGLVYYNFRYYFPAIGKWLTKDPIGERGGWNLYAFCENDAVNTWDVWGQIYENKSLNETNDPYLRFLSGLKYDEIENRNLIGYLQELEHVKQKNLNELSERLVSLCKKEKNQPYQYAPCLSEKECVRIAQELAIVIIDAIYNKVGQTIDMYGIWPIGGWFGNLFSPGDEDAIGKVGLSYKCGFWSKLIYTETEKYFLYMSIPENTMKELTDCSDETKDNILKSMQTAFGVADVSDKKHAWIEIYGPNTEYGKDKKGDFSIDPWKKGGKEIQYHVDKRILDSMPSRSIFLRDRLLIRK